MRAFGKSWRVAAAALIAVIAIVVIVARPAGRTLHNTVATPALTAADNSALTLGSATMGRPIPPGFVGLSMEFRGLEAYVGTDPSALDPAFIQLIRDITPNQQPVLRIGGDSTDWTWWPVPKMARPPGVKYDLTPDWMSVARSLTATLHARLILGVNLEADNRAVASAEGHAMVDRIGRNAIKALEIGNEPELYASFGWYKSLSGQQVPGRPPGYDEAGFFRDFSSFAGSLPDVALAGPSSGSAVWLAELGSFLRDESRVRLATVHAYPLKHCASNTVTIGELLSDTSSHGLALAITPWLAAAAQRGVPLRVDEINAVTCGGQRGVSNVFGSALWALDTMFELAKIGVNGVNIQTVPNTINEVLGATFANGSWQVRVHPEYYGLIMFAQAAPPGALLLRLSSNPLVGVKVWATRAPGGRVHVVVINKHLRASETVRLRIPSAHGPASIEQLRAPSITAESGVTLGGQTFGSTTSTGVLAGHAQATTLDPTAGTYVVQVPAASATMLTLSSG